MREREKQNPQRIINISEAKEENLRKLLRKCVHRGEDIQEKKELQLLPPDRQTWKERGSKRK